MLLMGKSTISIVIFNSKLFVDQRVKDETTHPVGSPRSMGSKNLRTKMAVLLGQVAYTLPRWLKPLHILVPLGP